MERAMCNKIWKESEPECFMQNYALLYCTLLYLLQYCQHLSEECRTGNVCHAHEQVKYIKLIFHENFIVLNNSKINILWYAEHNPETTKLCRNVMSINNQTWFCKQLLCVTENYRKKLWKGTTHRARMQNTSEMLSYNQSGDKQHEWLKLIAGYFNLPWKQ